MKPGNIVIILLVVCIVLAGCAQAEVLPEILLEVHPGIYMSNDPADFPFPTSGYTIYIVGETHGNKETKLIFQAYLQRLYNEAGLRDIILEEDQAYETDANAYVLGLTDELITGLCLRTDILGQIREFNASLPGDEKVEVHLVDVDSPLPTIYKHITELHQQLGAAATSIRIPNLSDFKGWVPQQRNTLIEELKNVSKDQPNTLKELDTVDFSLHWYNLGNRLDTGRPTGLRRNFAPIREDVITQNIQHVLTGLDGKPVLVFFGSAHGMKIQGDPNPPVQGFKAWAQRLVESDISVYSLSIEGLSGSGYWRERTYKSEDWPTDEIQFQDGSPLVSLFDTYPDIRIIYSDLRLGDNTNIRLSSIYQDLPAGQIYDGLIIFKEFTPMENVCLQ